VSGTQLLPGVWFEHQISGYLPCKKRACPQREREREREFRIKYIFKKEKKEIIESFTSVVPLRLYILRFVPLWGLTIILELHPVSHPVEFITY
jgi:hypothetical protein